MFYYIDQPHTQFFSTGLVKTESDFTVRSAETSLRIWTLVVEMISVGAYLFWLSLTWPVTLKIRE